MIVDRTTVEVTKPTDALAKDGAALVTAVLEEVSIVFIVVDPV
jgi:hypothetical protein